MNDTTSEAKKTRKSDLIRKVEDIDNIDGAIDNLLEYAKKYATDKKLDLTAAAKDLKFSKTVVDRLYILGAHRGLGEYAVVYVKVKTPSTKKAKIMVNKKGNITIGKTLYEEFNKLHEDEALQYTVGNEFSIEILADKIILTRITT